VKDLFEEDEKRDAAGKKPLYFLKAFGRGYPVQSQQEDYSYELLMYIDEDQTSDIVLSINADDVAVVTSVCHAVIMTATAPSFEALSGTGLIHVSLTHLCPGFFALFSLTLECSQNAIGSSSRTRELAYAQQLQLDLPVYVSSASGSQHTCAVLLYDALGTLLRNSTVQFSTRSTCFCIGHCECSCDNASATQDCVLDWNPDTDRAVRSSGGLNLRSLFRALHLGYAAGMGILGALVGLGLLFLLAKCGALAFLARLCFGSGGGGGGEPAQRYRVNRRQTAQRPPPPAAQPAPHTQQDPSTQPAGSER
jgi:hypothetical protein